MTDRSEHEVLRQLVDGDERAFEHAYDLFHERARLVAWRISHRPDWLDDLLNEAWCRAFRQRAAYNPDHPFLVWLAGIIRNVYREHCRKSPMTIGVERPDGAAGDKIDELDPETISHEAEVLAGLNDCISRLGPSDAAIIRLRFFQGKTLRVIAEELSVPEATLRTQRLPSLLEQLKRCMDRKKIDFSEFFSAQGGE